MLENRRSRYLLYCLHLCDSPLFLPDVAHQLTAWEDGGPVQDNLEKRLEVYMSLYYDHLPQLCDAGVVEYSQADDVVAWGPDADSIRPTLEARLRAETNPALRSDGERIAYDIC